MMKRALITGIGGQDGYYLAELLLGKGYEVVGLSRDQNTGADPRFKAFVGQPGFRIVQSDLSDTAQTSRLMGEARPDEVYHLAAMSHVAASFQDPESATSVNALGTLRLLEAIRTNHFEDRTRFYQASTSELYGKAKITPQSEQTPFHPRSPYAVSKLYAHWLTINYREAYGFFACNGILFNHESPIRPLRFVTRKITHSAASIRHGKLDVLRMGNVDARRDWGYAKEYVEGMWKMLQGSSADDYVLATGEAHSVREFVSSAFEFAGIPIEWIGTPGTLEEKAVCRQSGRTVVEIDPQFMRPSEVESVVGDPSLAREKLGWEAKTRFRDLIRLMVDHDLALVAPGGNR